MKTIRLETTDSTNTYAKQNAVNFSVHDIVCITAEAQTAGRGRFGRPWVSPKGMNLYTTFVFRLPLETTHLKSLGQVMAASVARLLLNEQLHPQIKWPNDVLLSGKKLAGVLCETEFHRDFVQVFLGVGVNVNMDRGELETIDQPATSLKHETGRVWDKNGLLQKLQAQFTADLEQFKHGGFAPFHALFEQLLAHKGQVVRCFDGKKTWEGTCHSLTSDGQLNLYLADKTMHTVIAGEVKGDGK